MKLKKFIFMILIVFILNINTTIYAETETNQDVSIGSPSGILIEKETGKVLYEKNADQKMYPASTTKILTAILTIENISDLQEIATVSYNNIFSVPSGYSIDTLKVGEELSVDELLYALLIKSSNEAAFTLAEHVSGNLESFTALMNSKAKDLGCTNSNFVNPNGIHNENHYSTARDMALIAKYAMNNETFREYVKVVSHTLPITNKYDKEDRTLLTTNDLINPKNKNYYEYAIGIKTGYTTPAKNCLVAGAQKDGVELISVLFGAERRNESGYSVRDTDAKELFEYGFNNYTNKNISTNNSTVITETEIKGATKDTKNLKLMTDNDINIVVKNEDIDKMIKENINVDENLKAPIEKGTIVGKVSYEYDGIKYEANLIASENVEKKHILIQIIRIIFSIIFLFIIYIIITKKLSRKKGGKNPKYKYIYK